MDKVKRISLTSLLLFVCFISSFCDPYTTNATLTTHFRNTSGTYWYDFETLEEWGDNFMVYITDFDEEMYENSESHYYLKVTIVNPENSYYTFYAYSNLPTGLIEEIHYREGLYLGSTVIDMFETIVFKSSGVDATDIVPPAGDYELTFSINRNDGGEFPMYFNVVADEVTRTVPEKTYSLELSYNDAYSTNSLVDVQENLEGLYESNVRLEDDDINYLCLSSFTGPDAAGVITVDNQKEGILYPNENTEMDIIGGEWDWLFEDDNISCSGITAPYAALVAGDYEICMLVRNSSGKEMANETCVNFSVEDATYTIVENLSLSNSVCTLNDLGSYLQGLIQIESNMEINGSYALKFTIKGPEDISCSCLTEYVLSEDALEGSGKIRYLMLSESEDYNQEINSNNMACSNFNTNSDDCLPNGEYTLTFQLYDLSASSDATLLTLSTDSDPDFEFEVNNEELAITINPVLYEENPININELIENLSVSIESNRNISSYVLTAQITGDNLEINSSELDMEDITSSTKSTAYTLSQNDLISLLGEDYTVIINSTDNTDEDLYSGLLSTGTYTLCFTLLNSNGSEVYMDGDNCITFTVEDTYPTFTIDAILANNEAGYFSSLYSYGNLQLNITSNITYSEYQLLAHITGPGVDCQTASANTYKLYGTRNQTESIVFSEDFDDFMGCDVTTCNSTDLCNSETTTPTGDYTLSFELLDPYSASTIPWSDESVSSVDFSIVYDGKVLPPELTSPEYGERIDPQSTSQNIVFSWDAVSEPAGAEYTLQIVEMSDTTMNPNYAFSTMDPLFEEETGTQTTYNYTINDEELLEGYYYAFRVIASDPDEEVEYQNEGASEVWYFKYTTIDESESNDEDEDDEEEIDVAFYNRTVSGNYYFNYKNSEGYANIDNSSTHPFDETDVQLKVLYAYFPDASSAEDAIALGDDWTDVSDQFDDGDRILNTTTTGSDGSFTFTASVINEGDNPDFGYNVNLQNSSGTILSGVVLKGAVVTHSNDYFLFDRKAIVLDDDVSDLELYADARQYNMSMTFTCSGEIAGNYSKYADFAADYEGKAIKNYNVYVLKSTFPSGIPYSTTGDRKDSKVIIAKDETNSSGYVKISNLLESKGTYDKYYLVVEPKPDDETNYKFTTTTFYYEGYSGNADAIYNDEYSVPTSIKRYTLDVGMPEVYGYVTLEGQSDSYLADATINVTVLTDSQVEYLEDPPEEEIYLGANLYNNTGKEYRTSSDGSYSFYMLPAITSTSELSDFNAIVVPSKSGYSRPDNQYEIVKDMKMNERKRVDFSLKASCKVSGDIQLEDGEGVAGTMGVEDESSYTAEDDGSFTIKVPNYNYGFNLEAFPPTNLSASYFSETKEIEIESCYSGTDIGTIVLPKRQHSIVVNVVNAGTDPYRDVSGARVTVRYKDLYAVTDEDGEAHFQFQSPSVEDLEIIVEGPEDEDWVPVTWTNDGTLSDVESKDEVTITIPISKGGYISGTVTYGEDDNLTPIDSARVSISLGDGTYLITYTDEEGNYTLHNVPKNTALRAIAAKGSSQYVGDGRWVYLDYEKIEGVDFNLTVYNGMDITQILHLPIEVHELSVTSDGVNIKGAFYDFSSLMADNWKLNTDVQDELLVEFQQDFVASSEQNEDGIPYAIPKAGSITTSLTEIDWVYNDEIYFTQEAIEDIFTVDDDGDGYAKVNGKMQLVMMNYELNTGELGLDDSQFYIGNGSKSTAPERLAYTCIGKTTTTAFNLMDADGNELEFELYGFKTTASTKTSRLKSDKTMVLDSRLHTNLSNIPESQKDLNISVGKINITETEIEPVSSSIAFDFLLDKWSLSIPKWTLKEGGIYADSCLLKIPSQSISIDDFVITYTTLGSGIPEMDIETVVLADCAPVGVKGSTYFEYDETEESWCIDVRPTTGSGTNSTQAAVVSDMNIIGDEDEISTSSFIMFADNDLAADLSGSQSVSVYSISSYSINSIDLSFDKFEMDGALNLNISGLGSKNTSLDVIKSTANKILDEGTSLYESVADIEAITGSFSANSVTVQLKAAGQKFEEGVFEAASSLLPVGVEEGFSSAISKGKESVEAIMDAGQSFSYAEGQVLNELDGALESIETSLSDLLPTSEINELNDLSESVADLKSYVSNLDLPTDEAEALYNLAASSIEDFKDELNNLLSDNVITDTYKETLASLGEDYSALADKIESLDISDDVEAYLIEKAGAITDYAEDTWEDLDLEGTISGMVGGSGVMEFAVNSDWVASDQEIGIQNVPSDFGGIGLTYNIEKQRMEGSLSFEQDFDVAVVKGDASIIIGAAGWYFLATGEFSFESLNIEGQAGIMFGNHAIEDEIDEMFKEISYYYEKLGEMPENYPATLSGFYFEAGARFPVFSPSSFNADFIIGGIDFGIQGGGDVRMGTTFGDGVTTYSIGQGVFLDAWLEARVGFFLCVEIDLNACAGMDVSGEYSTNGDWSAEGIGYVIVSGRCEVGGGWCFGSCDGALCTSKSKSANAKATVEAHIGSDEKSFKVTLE